MRAIRQILVPVDFSEPSKQALDYAATLARPFDASIDVLHVFEIPSFLPVGGTIESAPSQASVVELARANAERVLAEFVADARARGVQIRNAIAELGLAPQTITAVADGGGYDLVVMGTHGRTGFARALIGSVAERVVRHARCPVLSVRALT